MNTQFSNIRKAASADSADGARLATLAYRMYVERMTKPPAPMSYDYASVFSRGNSFLYILNGTAIGMITLVPSEGWLELSNLAVDPAFQGQGYGRTLLMFAEGFCAERGLREVRLFTNEVMVENIELYTRIGYRITERAIVSGYSRVFMSKQLALSDADSSRHPG